MSILCKAHKLYGRSLARLSVAACSLSGEVDPRCRAELVSITTLSLGQPRSQGLHSN